MLSNKSANDKQYCIEGEDAIFHDDMLVESIYPKLSEIHDKVSEIFAKPENAMNQSKNLKIPAGYSIVEINVNNIAGAILNLPESAGIRDKEEFLENVENENVGYMMKTLLCEIDELCLKKDLFVCFDTYLNAIKFYTSDSVYKLEIQLFQNNSYNTMTKISYGRLIIGVISEGKFEVQGDIDEAIKKEDMRLKQKESK